MPLNRPVAILLPAALLLLLAAFAAYPWRLPFGAGFALPLLGLLTTAIAASRHAALPSLLLAFAAGLACDLSTHAPLGFWALLGVVAAMYGGAMAGNDERRGGWLRLLPVAPLSAGLVWGLSSLYLWQRQPLQPILDGLGMAVLLLPLVLLLLIGLEPLFGGRREERP
jgi:hypothetical protein